MSSTEFDVLGIGNAIVDVLSRTSDDFLTSENIEKGSMTLIDQERAVELYQKMGPGIEISGGSAANTVAGIASFGGKPSFVGKVKNDQLGNVFSHDIKAIGVEFTTQPLDVGPETARCLVLVTPDGQRSMNTFLGASSFLTPDDVKEHEIASAQITYLEGYLWDPQDAKNAFLKASTLCRKHGRKIAMTLSDAFCVERFRAEFRDLVKNNVDLLFANEDEIISLYEADNFDHALQLARADISHAALTRSEKGCVILDGDDVHVVDAEPVEEVVDTTGAGDLFAAGYMFGVTHGKDAAVSGQLGALAASEIISHMGARPETGLSELAKSKGLI